MIKRSLSQGPVSSCLIQDRVAGTTCCERSSVSAISFVDSKRESMELAPVPGLADVIVDIVESGRTLKENGLTVIEDVLPVSARLAVNKAAYHFKKNRIEELLAKLRPKEETL